MESDATGRGLPPATRVDLSVDQGFGPRPGERVLRAGGMFCGRGEVHPSDLRPGTYRAQEAKVFLTTGRLVATRVRPYYLFGPLIWPLLWLLKPRILFAIPLAAVAVVEAGTAQTKHFVVWTVDGQKFSFKPTGAWAQHAGWVAALTKQAAAARPDAEVVTEGRSTYFQPRAGS